MKMRSRKVLIIIGFLITWTYITYYILLRNNVTISDRPDRKHVEKKDQQLIQDAQMEAVKSVRLKKKLVEVLKVIYPNQGLETTKDLPIGANGDIKPFHTQSDDAKLYESPGHGTHVMIDLLPKLTHLANGQPVIPILVFSCNRVSVKKCLDNLIQYRPSKEQFPIIVSQDCGDELTRKTILAFGDQLTHIEQPDQSEIYVPPKEKKFKGYYKIARHYGWALNTTFERGYDFVVIVEDDLNVSPDFYEYFLGTHKLLKDDSSLWCVSAWNDNGKANFIDVSKPELLYRTDFFPGLGWMLTRELWQELSVKWPKSFWDDWIRHPAQRKNRVCIRPEISRTRTFGKFGVSNGLFFDKYLKYIKLSEDFVEFSKMNLSYLLKDNYDRTFIKEIYTYPIVTYDELRRNLITTTGPVRIQYTSREQYKRMTKMLGLMDDFKSGVPRTAYHGIVSFFYNKRRVHLAPNANWKGYDLSWS